MLSLFLHTANTDAYKINRLTYDLALILKGSARLQLMVIGGFTDHMYPILSYSIRRSTILTMKDVMRLTSLV